MGQGENEIEEKIVKNGESDTHHDQKKEEKKEENKDGDKICRICHGGSEDEEEMGKLFSPCQCKGSMKYVHVGCLNLWREKSSKKESYFMCDQCFYRYNFSRTSWAHFLERPYVIHITTIILFVMVIFLSGYVGKLIDFDVTPLLLEEEDITENIGIQEGIVENLEVIPTLLPQNEPVTSFWMIDFEHWLKGIFVVGIGGFIHLILSFFMLTGTFREFLFFRAGGGGNQKDGLSLMLLIAVIVGLVRALYSVYKFVNWGSQIVLAKMSAVILEVPST